MENLFAIRPPIVTLWAFGGGSVRVLPAGRFATDNRLAELTIEPKLILPTRGAWKSLGVQAQLYARLIWAFGLSGRDWRVALDSAREKARRHWSKLMPQPTFTDAEQYLINAVRSSTASTDFNSYMWGYIVAGFVLAGFAGYNENVLMMFSAFVVVCGFRIYEDRYQRRWAPTWRSIIEKYETSLRASDTPNNGG